MTSAMMKAAGWEWSDFTGSNGGWTKNVTTETTLALFSDGGWYYVMLLRNDDAFVLASARGRTKQNALSAYQL